MSFPGQVTELRRLPRARVALGRVAAEQDPILQLLWLAKAVDYAVGERVMLVGEAAASFHTGRHRPGPLGLAARLDDIDRRSLIDLGFEPIGGSRFGFHRENREVQQVEFLRTVVEAEASVIRLGPTDTLDVIRREWLIVEYLLRAARGHDFGETVSLCAALFDQANWEAVAAEVDRQASKRPGLALRDIFDRAGAAARAVVES